MKNVTINQIYVLSSPKPDDANTARRLYEDLSARSAADVGPQVSFVEIADLNGFKSVLSQIKESCAAGVTPLIHIDCHGDRDKGLQLSNGEYVRWGLLASRFREIYKASNFNFAVVLAACFGRHVLHTLDIHQSTPFALLVGADSVIDQGTIDEKLPEFYSALFDTGVLNEALECLPSNLKPYVARQFLANTLINYFKKQCQGKGREKRINAHLDEVLAKVGNNRENRRIQRKRAKRFIKPTKRLVMFYERTFLGYVESIDFEELMRLARSA